LLFALVVVSAFTSLASSFASSLLLELRQARCSDL
jgi:hypothetical protein